MNEETSILAPPLTGEQITANHKFQEEMRTRYALPQMAQNREQYSRRYIADTLNILTILQNQFETTNDEIERTNISEKSRQIKIDICQWMVALGMFSDAVVICPDEREREIYQSYLDAEDADDGDWCEHPRYRLNGNGKTQPNFYREFDYFSPKRTKLTSMTRCSECKMRNATDVPEDLLALDRKQQEAVEKYRAENSR